ncbi:unnamed protein product [Rhizoctonia solani]|uniref:L-ornithine N(5)-oxygenase n=1 Tax=Rhizoctonia solani TaxID=456999 RepID=A0A8H3GXQ0_9AGAM|nr:unnamed protein product [Rhizoctonia solani]
MSWRRKSEAHGGKTPILVAPVMSPDIGTRDLSFEPNPGWSRPYAPREEIREYWKGIVTKHRIEPHIKFNTENVSTRQVTQVTAKIVISTVGFFRHPHWPDVPGRGNFKGDLLHAQMWDHNVSLSGKRVALIGNGCAGSQILPAISEDSSITVTNFCRTPSWYIPRNSKPVSEWTKWCFRYVPYALRSQRYLHVGLTEQKARTLQFGLE